VTPVPEPVTHSSAPSRTAIHLVVQANSPNPDIASLWAEVEWQDDAGAWHAVSGWQGPLTAAADGQGEVTWYLGAAELGAGPFRWSLYDGQGGARLASSSPFSLPETEGSTVTVEMQLAPQPLLPQSGDISPALIVGGLSLMVGATLTLVVGAGSRRRRRRWVSG
jgi:hypothetical protein